MVGAGYWGPNLARNLVGQRGLEGVVVCDLDPVKLEKMKERFPSVETTRDFDAVLGDRPPMVSVTNAEPERIYELLQEFAKDVRTVLPPVLSIRNGRRSVVITGTPEQLSRFELYCEQRLRGALLDELRSQDWLPRPWRQRLELQKRTLERLRTATLAERRAWEGPLMWLLTTALLESELLA